jgi:hypothetical protein
MTVTNAAAAMKNANNPTGKYKDSPMRMTGARPLPLRVIHPRPVTWEDQAVKKTETAVPKHAVKITNAKEILILNVKTITQKSVMMKAF